MLKHKPPDGHESQGMMRVSERLCIYLYSYVRLLSNSHECKYARACVSSMQKTLSYSAPLQKIGGHGPRRCSWGPSTPITLYLFCGIAIGGRTCAKCSGGQVLAHCFDARASTKAWTAATCAIHAIHAFEGLHTIYHFTIFLCSTFFFAVEW